MKSSGTGTGDDKERAGAGLGAGGTAALRAARMDKARGRTAAAPLRSATAVRASFPDGRTEAAGGPLLCR